MPLMFSSPAMFPAKAMPEWLKTVSHFNPVTYVVLPIRALVYKGWQWADLFLGVGIVLLFVILTGGWAIS